MHRALFAAALLAALVTAPASATVCVNPNKPSCEPTIQAGVDAAAPGELVKVAPGSYVEDVLIATDGITLKGPRTAVVQGIDVADPNAAPGQIWIQAQDVTVQGLSVRHGRNAGIRVESGSDGATIQKVAVQGTASSCIRVAALAANARVEGSTLEGCGADGIEAGDAPDPNSAADGFTATRNSLRLMNSVGIEVYGQSVRIEGNRVEIASGEGIFVEGDNALVEANRLESMASGFIDVSGDGARILRNQGSVGENDPGIQLSCDPCTGGEISDNRVSQVLDNDGIRVEATGPVQVAGNRLDRLGESGIVVDGASDGVVLSKNVVSRCGENGVEIQSGTVNTEVSENKVNDCGFDCYDIQGDGHTLRRNQAKGCLEDGFDVNNPSVGVTLTDNKASKIQGVGLEVSLNVTNASLTGDSAKGSGRADLCDAGSGTSITGVQAPVEETPPGGGDCPVD